jgi:hypothetical protein
MLRPVEAPHTRIGTLVTRSSLLPLAIALLLCSCSLEGELVHIVGTAPADLERVTLRATPASGEVGVTSLDIDPATPGRFEITTHVESSLCEFLEIDGSWCECGLFTDVGDGTIHRTQTVSLGSCGEHTVALAY